MHSKPPPVQQYCPPAANSNHSGHNHSLRSMISFHAKTILLFTFSDIKTIFLPVSVFGCATAPIHSFTHLLRACSWIWLHQLMCNISNQARGYEEDALNKPWRPLPSGRITTSQAVILRWSVVGLCVLSSASFGIDLVWTSMAVILVTFLYDELGLAGHYIGKNFCNIGGYTALELGATKLMGATRRIDDVSTAAIMLSGALIFTTIQAQDFADVEGDKKLGRVTFPIYAPEASRRATFVSLLIWSVFLCGYWCISPLYSMIFVTLGGVVGCRYYSLRSAECDRFSYFLYNIWLTIAHTLPAWARASRLTSPM